MKEKTIKFACCGAVENIKITNADVPKLKCNCGVIGKAGTAQRFGVLGNPAFRHQDYSTKAGATC